MEHDVSTPCSKAPATGPNTGPGEFSPNPHTRFLQRQFLTRECSHISRLNCYPRHSALSGGLLSHGMNTVNLARLTL